MNTKNDTGFRTFLVGTGGVTRHTRVKLSSGTIVTAGAGEDGVGVALSTEAAGAYCAVKLNSAPGTQLITSAGAITAGAAVYGAASGQIDDTVSGNKIGIALEAATDSGQDIEVLPVTPSDLLALQTLIADPASAASLTQESLTDSTTGVASTTLAAQGAPTTHAITDSSTGTASTTEIAEITGSANAGSADLAPVENAVATLAAEDVLIKADIATVRTEVKTYIASLAAQLAKIKTDVAAVRTGSEANNTAIDSIIDALQANGIVATA